MEDGEDSGALVVEVVFHVSDERHGRTVAAQMIDRAHEIANLPECECDLDVNVRWLSSSPPPSSSPPLSPSPPPSSSPPSSPAPPGTQQTLE